MELPRILMSIVGTIVDSPVAACTFVDESTEFVWFRIGDGGLRAGDRGGIWRQYGADSAQWAEVVQIVAAMGGQIDPTAGNEIFITSSDSDSVADSAVLLAAILDSTYRRLGGDDAVGEYAPREAAQAAVPPVDSSMLTLAMWAIDKAVGYTTVVEVCPVDASRCYELRPRVDHRIEVADRGGIRHEWARTAGVDAFRDVVARAAERVAVTVYVAENGECSMLCDDDPARRIRELDAVWVEAISRADGDRGEACGNTA
jgi:hypothetical protein